MILTREWLNDFIDINDVDNKTLSDTLNTLGLEVESLKEIKVVDDVVIGYVKECIKHPNADKLNLCQVDIGSSTEQIICGASNVKEGIYVAVATIGAVLDNGLKIKKATLRDIDSFGMICSWEELGFAPVNDGIMVIDESIGELELGKELNEYGVFNDTVIDIDITPNRGDCLSILGVARDLSCGLNKSLKKITLQEIAQDSSISISKSIKIDFGSDIKSNLQYRLINADELKNNLHIDLFFSHINNSTEHTPLQKLITYITHSTGVILNSYNIGDVSKKQTLKVQLSKDNLSTLILEEDNVLSIIGARVCDSKIDENNNGWVLLEASYEPPTNLSINIARSKEKTDLDIYFKSSRGSSPDIVFGVDYFSHIIALYNLPIKTAFGYIQSINTQTQQTLVCPQNDIVSIIGNDVSISAMADILNALYFETSIDFSSNILIVKIPLFRHDISSIQDIAEEILRVYGIDNIEPKPLIIEQKRTISNSFTRYLYNRKLRDRCVDLGFFENISFVFSSKIEQEKLGFEVLDETLEITNPITNDLNTLRSSILPNLLQAIKHNKNNNFNTINLFEIGSVFDAQRNETSSLAFVSSGLAQLPNITNHSKPKTIDFYTFANNITNIITGARIEDLDNRENNALINPYQSASVWIGKEYIGHISKLHSKVQNDMKLDDTFIAQFDLQKIFDLQKDISFKAISKYQRVHRDLSLVVDKSLHYSKIRAFILELNILELKSFSPIDIFVIDELRVSISIRFTLQSSTKTLSEEDISSIVMDNIYNKLSKSMKIELRS